MNSPTTSILLVEDNPGDADLVRQALAGGSFAKVQLTHLECLSETLQHLATERCDAVLLDLSLPDSDGLETLLKAQAQAPAVPIVVLTGLADEATAVKAVQAGAQDYLLKGHVNSADLLNRSLRYAMERKQADAVLAQERTLLHSLMDNIPDTIYFKDKASRFLRINRAVAERCALKDPAQALGKTDFDFFTEPYARQTFADEQEVMRTGQPMVGKEEKETWPDGRETWVSTTKMPLRDERGQIVGTFGVSRDITERKRVEVELRKQAAELEHSNAELQQFAVLASHDLQEPLRKVQTFGDLLAAKAGAVLGEIEHDYLKRMRAAAQRMQGLLNDLLTYARVTSQARPFVPVNLNRVAREVLSDLEVRISSTGGSVDLGELPQLDSDPVQMRQLLQNLIANALKFHRPDVPPVIVVSTRSQEPGVRSQESGIGSQESGVGSQQTGVADSCPLAPDSRFCEITIRDNGIGFEEKYLDRIFLPFQRLHGMGEYEGTGMGLAICRKIVERHGGTITARSTPGQGTTFVVLLPLRQPKGNEHHA